jgi:DNA-binding transcriptional MerR regulator
MKENKQYSLGELTKLTDITGRNIRFYIQQGIVDKPEGTSRGAHYTETHLRQLMTVKKYKDLGVSLDRIAQIIHEEEQPELLSIGKKTGALEVVSRITLAEGVELTINPEQTNLDQSQIRQLAKIILEQLDQIKKEKS